MSTSELTSHYATAYGHHADAARVNVALALLKHKARLEPTRKVRVLDVGGGDMRLGRLFAQRLEAMFGVTVELEGWDFSEQGVAQARAAGEKAETRSIGDPIPAEAAGAFDLVLFFEVLEHLVDTDAAVINLRKLLKPDGWLVLSTPNLAGWMNRVSLLFGLQPHVMEVSFVPRRFGHPLMQRFVPYAPGDSAAGHLRAFTLRALREFLAWHGFHLVAARGCINHSFDFVTRLVAHWWPGLAGDVVVLCRPATP